MHALGVNVSVQSEEAAWARTLPEAQERICGAVFQKLHPLSATAALSDWEVAVRFDQATPTSFSLFAASKRGASKIGVAILQVDPTRQSIKIRSSRLLLCTAALLNNDQFSVPSSSSSSNPFAIDNRSALAKISEFKRSTWLVWRGILWIFPPPVLPPYSQVSDFETYL